MIAHLFPLATHSTTLTFCSGMHRNQNFGLECDLCLNKAFWVFASISKLSKKAPLQPAHFTMEQLIVVSGNFAASFSHKYISIFVRISGSRTQSLERSFSSAELEYRRCRFWSKVMMQELEEKANTHHGWLWVAWESMG